MNKKLYVDVKGVCEDWGVSRAQGYKMIKQLNERMLAMIRILLYWQVKQIENFMRKIVTEQQSKHE